MSAYVWLASYPKSGNTWVRAFLSSVQQNGGAIDINRLDAILQPSERHVLDETFGFATSDLTWQEILQARPAALAAYAEGLTQVVTCKVHEAWLCTPAGLPLFPPHLTRSSVYIARDPRDVAVSFAHHLGIAIDDAIALMADPQARLGSGNRRLLKNTAQPLLTWSQHVTSWLDEARPAPLLVRYEDMLAEPLRQGILIARHLGLEKEPEVYERAIERTCFGELSRQERAQGFLEAIAPDRRFFRSGKVGTWREALAPNQIARIEEQHGVVMARLGYQ